MEIFNQYPAALIGAATVLGLIVGSFLNVVIYRVPKMLEQEWRQGCCELLEQPAEEPEKFNLMTPASSCPHCQAPIRPWQNIPIISYLLLKGRCGSCSAGISMRYPLVELATGLIAGFLAWKFGWGYELGAALCLSWALISLTLIDADTQLLPDNITLPLLWLGLIANYFGLFTSLEQALWGAVWGYMSLWSIFWLFKLVTGKEGMGYGDFKLLAALGAWMGWQALPAIILLSSVVGAVIGVAGILIMGKDKNKPMPFGPYLAIAGWIQFCWGEAINQAYLSLL